MKRTSSEFHAELEARTGWHSDLTYSERERVREEMYQEWYKEMTVGDHAHVLLWSDIEPVTIIKQTATTLTVRYDKAERDPNWKPEWVVGGFSAICTNSSDQRWIIEEDPNGRTEVFRWHRSTGEYVSSSGLRLRPEWHKKYDYNF